MTVLVLGEAVVFAQHLLCLALERDEVPPSAPRTESATFHVVLTLAGATQPLLVGTGLSLAAARFVRDDILNACDQGRPRWSLSRSLQEHADGAYFAVDA